MRALTCEATLVSLVIEDIFQDKADERTVNLLRLLAGRSEGVCLERDFPVGAEGKICFLPRLF